MIFNFALWVLVAAPTPVFFTIPEFTHIEFEEDVSQAGLNGTNYCYVALHKNELRIPHMTGYLPCEMVRTVLSHAKYENAPRDSYGNFRNIIRLNGDQIGLEKTALDLHQSFSMTHDKILKFDRPLIALLPLVQSKLIALECPEIPSSGLNHWAIVTAFNEPAWSPLYIDHFIKVLVGSPAKKAGTLITEVSGEDFPSRPRCEAKFYEAKRGKQKMKFYICAGEPYFECFNQ